MKNMYSEQDLLDEIQRLSKEHCDGRPPTQTDMINNGKHSKTTYNNRFDSWANVLEKAGFSKKEISESEGNPYYGKDVVINEIQRISEEFCENEAPKLKEFCEYSKVSKSLIYNNFNSLEEALQESGFSEGESGMDTYSKEYILEEIERVSEQHCHGESPALVDIREFAEISGPTIMRHFGKYNKALQSIDLEINSEYDIDEEVIVSEIKRVSEVYLDGDRPTRKEFNKYSKYSSSLCSLRFGSWSKAVEKAGFNKEYKFGYDIKNEEIISEIKRISKIVDKERPTHTDFVEHSSISHGIFARRTGSWNDFLEKAGFQRNGYGFNPNSGEEHYAWKGGGSLKYGPSYYKRKWEVRERDDEKCGVCESDNSEYDFLGNIDVHHIAPARYWKDEEHEVMNHPRNLICLCRSCHAQLEGKFKGRNYQEFKRLAREYLDMEEPVNDKGVF